MKPYYQKGNILLFHGDCRNLFHFSEALPVFDAVVTDPPYGDTSLNWDVQCSGWLPAIEPMLSPTSSIWTFGSLRFFLGTIKEFDGWRLAQEIVWEKHNGSSFHADRFKRVHELAVQFYRGQWRDVYKAPVTTHDATARAVRRKKRPPHTGHIEASSYVSEDGGPRLMRSVIQVRSCHGYAKHPTQKPEGIVAPLVEYSTPIGGAVLDPFCGSGTTLRVCKQLGRFAVGVEREEKYCEIAAKLLDSDNG